MYAHVGFQDPSPVRFNSTEGASVTKSHARAKRPCRNGTCCIWLAQNRCTYSHQEQVQPHHEPRQVQGSHVRDRQGGWQVQGGQK